MSKEFIKKNLKVAVKFVKKNSPTLLSVAATGGFILTTVLACDATLKAVKVVEEVNEEHEGEGDIPKKEYVKRIAPLCIKPLATGAAATYCIFKANSINSKRLTAAVAAYDISRTALRNFKESAYRTVGAKKVNEIIDDSAKTTAQKVNKDTEWEYTGRGNVKCIDGMTGRHFYSDINEIKSGLNAFNEILNNADYSELNELHEQWGLEPTGAGSILGFHRDDGLLELTYSSQLIDGEPCLVIDYVNTPIMDYAACY